MVLGVRIYKHSIYNLLTILHPLFMISLYFEWYIRTCSGKFVTDHRPILSGQGLSKTSFFRVSKLGKKGCFFGGGGVSPKIVHYPPGGGGSLRKMSKNGLFSGFFCQKWRPSIVCRPKSWEIMFRASEQNGPKRNRKKQHFFRKLSKSPQRLLYFWGVFCPTAR